MIRHPLPNADPWLYLTGARLSPATFLVVGTWDIVFPLVRDIKG